MPQANVSGPSALSLGLLGSWDVLRDIAVTPLNPSPQTPRGKEIVAQALATQRRFSPSMVLKDALGHLVSPLVADRMQQGLGVTQSGSSLPAARLLALSNPTPGAAGSAPSLTLGPVQAADAGLEERSVQATLLGQAELGHSAAAPHLDEVAASAIGAEREQLSTSTQAARGKQCVDFQLLGCNAVQSKAPGELTLGDGSTTTTPTPVSTPARRSGRHAVAMDGTSSTDEDSMMKAMRRKAELNLDNAGMNKTPKSFLAFSDSSISAKLNSIGFSLGKNAAAVTVSTNALRNLEYDR